jgi:hypothetical protein
MMFEESRMLQVSIFETLQKNLAKIDFSILLNAATRSQLTRCEIVSALFVEKLHAGTHKFAPLKPLLLGLLRVPAMFEQRETNRVSTFWCLRPLGVCLYRRIGFSLSDCVVARVSSVGRHPRVAPEEAALIREGRAETVATESGLRS